MYANTLHELRVTFFEKLKFQRLCKHFYLEFILFSLPGSKICNYTDREMFECGG